MAVNHDCSNLSPLPTEVKKLQQMNDQLFAQINQCDTGRLDDFAESDNLRNGRSANKSPNNGNIQTNLMVHLSPELMLNKTTPRLHHTFPGEEDHENVVHSVEAHSTSNKSSERGTPTDGRIHSPTFTNPLDYSTHSRMSESGSRSHSKHASPAMKSMSSGTSHLGSFSSSSSPSPSLPESATSTVFPAQPRLCDTTNKTMSHYRTMDDDGVSCMRPLPSLENEKTPVKRRGRMRKDLPSMCADAPNLGPLGLNGTSGPGAMGVKPHGLKKPVDSMKASMKRHNASNLPGAGGTRATVSTAAYKYLTWREKDRRRRFREEWKHLWLVIPHGRYEVMCLVCHKVMTQRKLDTIKRHTVRRHVELLGMPEIDRQNLFEQLVKQHNVLGALDPCQTTNNSLLRGNRKSSVNMNTTGGKASLENGPPRSDGAVQQSRRGPKPRVPDGPAWSPGRHTETTTPHHHANKFSLNGPLFSPGRNKMDMLDSSVLNLPQAMEQLHSLTKGPHLSNIPPPYMPVMSSYPHIPPNMSNEQSGVDTRGTKRAARHSQMETCRSGLGKPLIPGTFPYQALAGDSIGESPFSYAAALTSGVSRPSPKPPNTITTSAAPTGPLNQTRSMAMNQTFAQILEQLANSRSKLFPNDAIAASVQSTMNARLGLSMGEESATLNSHPLCKPPPLTNPFMMNPKLNMFRENLKTVPSHPAQQNTAINNMASNPDRARTRIVDQLTNSLHSSSQASSVPDSLSSGKVGQSAISAMGKCNSNTTMPPDSPAAFAMAAVATAQSLMRLSPGLWPPPMPNDNQLHRVPHPFNNELNPMLMATWMAAMAAAAIPGAPHNPPTGSIRPPHAPTTRTKTPPTQGATVSRTSPIHSKFPFNYPTGNPMTSKPFPTFPTDPSHGFTTNSPGFSRPGSNMHPWDLHRPGNHMNEHKVQSRQSISSPLTSCMDPLQSGANPSFQVPTRNERSNESHKPSLYHGEVDQRSSQEVPSGRPVCSNEPGMIRVSDPNLCRSDPHFSQCYSTRPQQQACLDRGVGHRQDPPLWSDKTAPKLSPPIGMKSINSKAPHANLPNCDVPGILDNLSTHTIPRTTPLRSPSYNNSPLPTPPLTSSLLDPTVMMYYSELSRQHHGSLPSPMNTLNSSNQLDVKNFPTQWPFVDHTTESKNIDKRHGVKGQECNQGFHKKPCNTSSENSGKNSPETSSCMEQANETRATPDSTSPKPWEPTIHTQNTLNNNTTSPVNPEERDKSTTMVDQKMRLSPLWSVSLNSSQPEPQGSNSDCSQPDHDKLPTVIRTHQTAFKVHILRLGPGQDLRESLSYYIVQKRLCGAFILTCCGSLQAVRLRLANLKEQEFRGPFEIVSLVGTLADNGSPHLHIALADSMGHVIGGHLAGSAPIHTTAELALGVLEGSHSTDMPDLVRDRETVSDTVITDAVNTADSPLGKRTKPEACEIDARSSPTLVTPNKRPRIEDQGPIRLVRRLDTQTGFDELQTTCSPSSSYESRDHP